MDVSIPSAFFLKHLVGPLLQNYKINVALELGRLRKGGTARMLMPLVRESVCGIYRDPPLRVGSQTPTPYPELMSWPERQAFPVRRGHTTGL